MEAVVIKNYSQIDEEIPGDGNTFAYDVDTGANLVHLKVAAGNFIRIDGIRGLTFGKGWSLGEASSQYFTVGPYE